MLEVVGRTRQSARAYVLPMAAGGVAFVVFLATTVCRDVYYGVPDSIPIQAIAATCQPSGAGAPCDAVVVRLNPGRFYVSTRGPATSLTVTIDDATAIGRPHVLLVRPEVESRVHVEATGTAPGTLQRAATRPGDRLLIDVPNAASPPYRVTIDSVSGDAPLVVSELGLFADSHGLLPRGRVVFQLASAVSFYSTYAAVATLAVCAFLVAAAWLAPVAMSRPAPWLVGVLCAAICILDLGTMFSPEWSRDIRSMYGAELVHSGANGNLTGGLYEGSRIVQGLGQTTETDTVPWHRMPGYGLLCAFAARLGGTTDVVEIAMVVIVLQVLFYAVAVGVFVVAARRLFGVPIACLLGTLIVLLPKQVNYTQVDSLIAPIALLVLSAIMLTISTRRAGEPPALRAWLLLNAAFALWFFMRNDVLPGWIVVSAALSGWRWRRLALPVTLIAAIALPWALYKRQYRDEFNLMPTNAGEVLFLGLCEVPGAFPFECTDAGYFAWAKRFSSGPPSSQRSSSLAVAEVVRHWVTYPVHFGLMILVKLRRCLTDESFPGFRTRISSLYAGFMRKGLFTFLLVVVGISVAVDHERRRSLLLGWPLLLNMPIFLLVFGSSGRFYTAASVGVIVTAVPLLFERGLLSQVRRHPWRGAMVVAVAALFVTGGPRVERWVEHNDSVHYWAPLLDPARSTLRVGAGR